ncbi:MAG: DUF3180 domain-containing protein [Sciscionella sp.]
MKYTRARDLILVAVIAGVVVSLLLQWTYSALPKLPRLAGTTLLVIAIIEFVLTLALRPRFQRKPDTTPVPPLTAVRVVAVAKASSLLGAIMFGAWGGVLGYVLPRNGIFRAAGQDTTSGVLGIVCAAALVGAALWLEYICRAPDPPEDSRGK